MKKLLLLAVCAVTMQLLHAQNPNEVTKFYTLRKYEDAKTAADKMMADPKQNTKPEAIYWKAKVYATIYKDTTLRAKYPSVKEDAEAALKAYTAADPAFAQVKEKGADPFFDMQSALFTNGIKNFNKKNWDAAANDFKASIEYSDLMFKNKWANANMAFDTTALLYTAYSYQNAKKDGDAVQFYKRMADAKVTSANGDDLGDIYKYIVDYYSKQKDEANFRKYIALAKSLYPKFPAEEFEMDYVDNNLTLEQKAAQFDKDDAAGTLSEQLYLSYGDMFSHMKDKDKLDSATISKYNLKAADAFKKAYAKNSQNAIAAFNVGIIYYNVYSAYDDRYAFNVRTLREINAAAAEKVEKDPKKKAAAEAALKAKTDPIKAANAELEKPITENLNVSLEWLEKAYNVLKDKPNRTPTEKNIINKSVDFLANLYAYKRDRLKGKDPKAFDEFDAKYKLYDSLHGKY